MTENPKKGASLFIKDIDLNTSLQANNTAIQNYNAIKNIPKNQFLNVPSPESLQRNNSLVVRKKEFYSNRTNKHEPFISSYKTRRNSDSLESIDINEINSNDKNRAYTGRYILSKQKSFYDDVTIKSINLASATNSDSKDYSSNDESSNEKEAASNYARDHKKNKMVQNNISIVISPLSDEDANEDKAKCSNPNNNNNQNDKYKLKTEENLPAREQSSEKTIDLSIFELLDHSSKKFILKPATMGLTIKSQVFRQKGIYPEYKFYLENLSDNLLLVMTARKRKKSKTTCYIINYISYDQTDVEKFIETPFAKLKSNLIGTQFLLYDFGIKPSKINENKHLLNSLSNNIQPVLENQDQSSNQTNNNDENNMNNKNNIDNISKSSSNINSRQNSRHNSIQKGNSFDTNFSSDNDSNDIQLLSSLQKEYLSILYELNFFGYKGPRQMSIIIPGMDSDFNREDFIVKNDKDSLLNSWKKLSETVKSHVSMETIASENSKKNGRIFNKKQSLTSQSSKKSNNECDANEMCNSGLANSKINVVKLINKSPVWHEQYKSFALNFNGRVTQPSVKNYQIIHEVNTEYIVSQFGKVNNDLFTCDYSYPLCALQAFSIALSSLDNKIGCD